MHRYKLHGGTEVSKHFIIGVPAVLLQEYLYDSLLRMNSVHRSVVIWHFWCTPLPQLCRLMQPVKKKIH